MSYTVTETAEGELDAILDYIADRDGLERALRVYNRFEEAFAKLSQTPGMGATRRHLTGDLVRWWPVFKFLVVYEADDAGITILRIVHGARYLEALFDSEQ
ncbi:MAG: type II toxin-antitoxin system RelE/ParE family toxin [Planctomycetes bacterium]|nr:type II toxin-antitoxin system RelE/ParE family toxin [Planctomycetota bacterium]